MQKSQINRLLYFSDSLFFLNYFRNENVMKGLSMYYCGYKYGYEKFFDIYFLFIMKLMNFFILRKLSYF